MHVHRQCGESAGGDAVTPPTGTDQLDIDIRFLLANERTLLAWLRTALTLQAGGVALEQLAGHSAVLSGVGIGLLTLGSIAGVIGYLRYRATGRAIRAGQLPAPGRGPALLTAGVVVLAAVLVAIYAVDHFG
jgi:putative membrane protein